jgi:glycosyltransferase involved in cell wall biosynthesis
VTVYSRIGRGQAEVELRDGVCYRRIRTRLDDYAMAFPERHPKVKRLPGLQNPKRPLFASSFAYLEYSLKVARDIRKRCLDLVHIHNFCQIIPAVRALNPRIKIVLHMNCEWLTQLDRRIVERRLRKADLVLSCCDYITGNTRRAFPRLADRCHTLYNGVDTNVFRPRDVPTIGQNGSKRVLFVGRIWPDKGPHILLDAFKRIAKQRPQAQLEFIGPKLRLPADYIVRLTDDRRTSDLAPLCTPGFFSRLQQMLTPEIAGRVSFHNPMPHPDLAEHYRHADIFVLPSVWNEPFALVTLEAMSSGLPVVATRGGGFFESVQDGKTGLLVERGNTSALAEALLLLLKDDSLRESMGRAGRLRAVERFSWDRVAQDALDLYGTVC